MAKSRVISEDKPFPPEGYRLGSDISCEEMSNGQIAITPGGQATTFLGFVDADHRRSAFMYSVCVADRTPAGRTKRTFVALDRGNVKWSSFLWENTAYRILPDVFLRLPTGTRSDYGVLRRETWEQDDELTRQIFGVTEEELDAFLAVFQSVVDFADTGYYRHARITFSKSRDNDCDISQAWIPKNFPFIAFGDTNFFRGHVSLNGFYRLMTFMCVGDRRPEPYGFSKLLVDAGADAEVIQRMKDAYFNGQGDTIINLEECLRRD